MEHSGSKKRILTEKKKDADGASSAAFFRQRSGVIGWELLRYRREANFTPEFPL